jgi:uncharacterized MAPEG superfamily protein
MTPTAIALLGFVLWTILLFVTLAVYRTSLVFAGKKKANEFRASGEDLQGFGQRATRAHANCYENLPAAAAVLLYAIATGQTAITDELAFAFLGARFLQSLTHLASTSRPAVLVRFAFYIVQIVILLIWILKLAHMI